ncbi:ABC-type dipeptide/oligopeptide/nickel transport system, permease protein [Natrialba chahannaoensis JCM 10990]|uniref:ABC-type dipeptide/oligopeptide/nickel transport system, permease protein n=1 Tax=Natrialba chahannaoensis JCM 10990 TaxID=1227492 RepID=M0A9Z1_9EURY|nr:ABC-type dipeptide/oligopeptide/nickel transport system, permease protein [Natrialba chahannaoensis JCM 10990]
MASVIGVLFAVSVITYGLIHLTPGDPAETILTQQLEQPPTPQQVEEFRAEQGLDEPVYIQYVHWLGDVLQGDLGVSYYNDRSVSALMIEALPATVELAVAGMLVSLAIALPAGVLSAVYQNTRIDRISQIVALLGVSVPNFWLGFMLILVFSIYLGVLPVSGVGGLDHLILPAIALGTGMAAVVTRLVRTSMLEVMEAEYIDTARSAGLSERIVIWKHTLRNALIPVVTVVGLQFGRVLNGTVVIEIVFDRPGLGALLVEAIFARDYPVVQGVVLLTAVVFVVSNFCVDLLYKRLDPRVTLGEQAQ